MFSQFETKDMGKREELWMRFSETETKDRYRRGEHSNMLPQNA